MDTDTDSTDHDGSEDAGTEPGERLLTQTEVNKLLAKTRNEGARSATRAVAEALGMSIDDAKAKIAAANAAAEAEMTAVERAKADADKVRAEAAQQIAAARAAQLEAQATVALLSGENPLGQEYLELALPLVVSKIDHDDPDSLPAAIEALRAKTPVWFAALSTNGDRRPATPPPATPGRRTNETKQVPGGPKERARAFWEAQQATRRPPMPNT